MSALRTMNHFWMENIMVPDESMYTPEGRYLQNEARLFEMPALMPLDNGQYPQTGTGTLPPPFFVFSDEEDEEEDDPEENDNFDDMEDDFDDDFGDDDFDDDDDDFDDDDDDDFDYEEDVDYDDFDE
jgi:hypothetical protein